MPCGTPKSRYVLLYFDEHWEQVLKKIVLDIEAKEFVK